MFGTSKVNKFDVNFVVCTLALFEKDYVLQLDVQVNDTVLVYVKQGTEELFNDFADKFLPIVRPIVNVIENSASLTIFSYNIVEVVVIV